MDRYTLDESPGDFAMESFSIDRDRQKLIPYVKAALKVRPSLKIWSSAWTPPTWMKTNGAFDSGAMKDDPRIYAAYALYLAKFVESYRAEGIDVFMVVPQNEPGQLTQYPSCDWTPAQYIAFIGDHLGPLFESRAANAEIWAGTFNVPTWDVTSVLKDPRAGRFIGGVCLQWGALGQVGAIHAAFPDMPIMQSETECGNNFWEPGYQATTAPNDFAYGAYTWRKFRDFFAAGSSSYMLWNMVLDERAKNLDAKSPWPQNSAIVVNRSTRQVTYTPMFWATKHFSGLVDPGARLIESLGPYPDVIAFANPDGSVVVQLLNADSAARSVRIAIGPKQIVAALPAKSFASLVVPPV
jgi:glucosylceramidase